MSEKLNRAGMIRRIIHRAKRQLPLIVLSVLLAVVSVAASLTIPILVGSAIDCMLEAGKVEFTTVTRYLTAIVGCAILSALCQWLMSELNNRITYNMACRIRNEVFAKLHRMPLSYLDKHSQGDVVSRVVADVDTFTDGLLMGFTQLFTGVFTIMGTLIFMLIKSWQIALVVVVITPLSLVVAAFIAKHTYALFQEQAFVRGKQTGIIEETIGQIKVVQAFGHEDSSLKAFDAVNGELESSSLRAIFISSLTNPSTRFVNSLVYAGVGLCGALIAIGGGITPGNLASFLNYANQYTKPFNEISGVVAELQNAVACAGRVFELLDGPEMPAEPEGRLDAVQGAVEVRDLQFSYVPEKPLIRDFHLRAEPGQKIAIVGPTGCGKTTIINLLMRFYEPQDGQILLDGVDISTISRESLRKSVGMVLQDTWLKNTTIRENIAMGRPDATDEEVIAAAKQARAHGFIMRLPKGYDTVVGEQGGTISQGQRQLLCIARVMLCLPPMLILDEATSSIDTRTEIQVQKAFDALMSGRTSFVVAHRLSTIREADLILVMEQGRIVEKGRHEELLQNDGLYAKLYNSQFVH